MHSGLPSASALPPPALPRLPPVSTHIRRSTYSQVVVTARRLHRMDCPSDVPDFINSEVEEEEDDDMADDDMDYEEEAARRTKKKPRAPRPPKSKEEPRECRVTERPFSGDHDAKRLGVEPKKLEQVLHIMKLMLNPGTKVSLAVESTRPVSRLPPPDVLPPSLDTRWCWCLLSCA